MDIVRTPTWSNEPGAPVEEGGIPLNVPELGGNEWKHVKECLDSGWVSSVGSFVTRFEHDLAGYVGAGHAVALVNGTAALHLALQIIGLQPGEEVLVPDLTFVAPVNAIRYCQAFPVLMDAHPDTWQMDPEKVERFLAEECELRGEQCYNHRSGRRVRAILPVHILGLACEIDRLVELARAYGLQVVEDAAEGMGVRYKDQHVGTFGDVGVFSFNGNKIITTGGGGAIVTNDVKKAEYARYLSTQAKDDPVEYVHNQIGYNYRLTNLQAAIGVAQLEQLDAFIEKKRAIARMYTEAFRELDGLTPMPTPRHTQATYWLYTVLLDERVTLDARKAVIKHLNAHGIGARPFWHTIHDLAPYRDCQSYEIDRSRALYRRGVSLPSSTGLTPAGLDRCIDVVKTALPIFQNECSF